MEQPNQRDGQREIDELALRLRAVIATATDGIITISERGIMETVNQAAAELFGYDESEMLGQNVRMLMPEPDKSNHDQYIKNYLNTHIAKIIGIGREVTGRKKNGTLFPIRLSISEVKLNDRHVFTGIVHDLTREKQAEAHIRRLNAELEQRVDQRTTELEQAISKLLNFNRRLEKEIKTRKTAEEKLQRSRDEIGKALEAEKELGELKSRFVSMASHEFRTPLSSILSSVELIEAYVKAEPHERRDKHIQRIKTSVKTLTTILNDFLSISKLEEGKVSLEPLEFPLTEFSMKLLDELRPTLKKGQQIDAQFPEEEITVYHDPRALKIIFTNLISNASKYSVAGKTIHFHIRWEDPDLILTVRDEGIGIPEADQTHLFTRFFRAHNVENIKGTGLGLNIIKQYIDLLGGAISFDSKEGVGTTFSVRMPRRMSDINDT